SEAAFHPGAGRAHPCPARRGARPLVSDAMLAIRLRALGDVVLTTPALRALHRGHPARPLDVLTDERYVGLLRGLPGVERVIGLRRGRGAMFEAIGAVRRRRYGTVVDFFGNPRSAAL